MSDILEQMTKQELIHWMRAKCWNKLPKLSDVLFARWERQTEAFHARRANDAEEMKKIDTKLRDDLARQHNQSSDATERLELLQKIIVIDDQVKSYFAKGGKATQEWQKMQALYDRATLEREKGN